jgi:hypothetical protein
MLDRLKDKVIKKKSIYEEKENKAEEKPKEKTEEKLKKPIKLPDTTYLTRELPFFRWEWLPYLFMTFLGIIFFFGDIILILLVNEVQLVHVLLMGMPLVLTILLMWGMYLIKFFFYMPSGKKILFMPFLKGGAAYMTVINPPEDNIYESKIMHPVVITKYRKHFELHSNKPLIIAPEGFGQNVNIHELLQNIPPQWNAKELDTVMRAIKNTAVAVTQEKLMGMKSQLTSPNMLAVGFVVILCLVIIIILAFLNGNIANNTALLEQINATLTTISSTLAAGG